MEAAAYTPGVRTVLMLVAATALGAGHGLGQANAAPKGPWFALELPSGTGAPAVQVGPRPPRPVVAPSGAHPAPELDAVAIKADVQTIVQFARDSRARRELGSGQMWGRIAGFPSSDRTVAWAADQFRQAGIKDVRLQPIVQDAGASLWLPLTWRVTLLADPAFGPGSQDLVLESALPVGPSQIAGGSLTAPLVYVGAASSAVLQHIDVKGKIAVQLIVPQGHMLFERGAVDARSEELVKRGAVGVFNLVRLPGQRAVARLQRLRQSMLSTSAAATAGSSRPCWREPRRPACRTRSASRIDLTTETFRGLKATNAVAVIPGRSPEAIVLNAHADAWFDGAGDNADGLAVLVALAGTSAKAGVPPERTLVFVASAGHHTPGINGPRSFVAANPELASQAVVLVNIEHVAQRNFSPARTTSTDGYREAVADSGEAPIAVGVTNNSPFLQALVDHGAGELRRELHLRAIDVPERRDRWLGQPEGGQGQRDAGAAAVPHHRRGARRDLRARPRADGTLPSGLGDGRRTRYRRRTESLERSPGGQRFTGTTGSSMKLAAPGAR